MDLMTESNPDESIPNTRQSLLERLSGRHGILGATIASIIMCLLSALSVYVLAAGEPKSLVVVFPLVLLSGPPLFIALLTAGALAALIGIDLDGFEGSPVVIAWGVLWAFVYYWAFCYAALGIRRLPTGIWLPILAGYAVVHLIAAIVMCALYFIH